MELHPKLYMELYVELCVELHSDLDMELHMELHVELHTELSMALHLLRTHEASMSSPREDVHHFILLGVLLCRCLYLSLSM